MSVGQLKIFSMQQESLECLKHKYYHLLNSTASILSLASFKGNLSFDVGFALFFRPVAANDGES